MYESDQVSAWLLKVSCGILMCIVLNGCSHVPVQKQRLVSKPNMQFSDSLVFNYSNTLQAQTEPGSVMSGGAKSAGCTSCK